MIKVRVPATSANLGPGYDCLGLALSWEGVFTFTCIDSGFQITGCASEYQNQENLVYQAFVKTLQYMGNEVCGIAIDIQCDLPLKRGLGSSAACIVAGAMGANALFGNPLNKYELFAVCTQLEGHPDNIAPALFGQLTVAFMDQRQPAMIRYGVHPDLKFLACIPSATVSTKQARELLPQSLDYQAAVYQMGHCAAMCKAIEIGNGVIMRKACVDHMHEPYRKQFIPAYEDLQRIQKELAAYAMFISGSGSTMIVVDSDETKLSEISCRIEKLYPDMETRILQANRSGAVSEEV